MGKHEAVPRGSSGRERGRLKSGGSAERASCGDDWLNQSEGFRVDSPNGRIGFVESILSDSGGPDTLVVRAGLFGRRLLLVSTENVVEVLPWRKRIVLRGSPRLVGPEPRAERRAEVQWEIASSERAREAAPSSRVTRMLARPETKADADAQRVTRAKRGEATAFEELIALHAPPLYRMLTRVLGNPTDAEQVAQAAFLEAWRSLRGFRGDRPFSTWLYRIAMVEANRRSARTDRTSPSPLANVVEDGSGLTGGPPPAQIESVLEAFLERCLAELPPSCRAAVVLRDVEGLTNVEAADVLGLTVADFKSRLHEGRMTIAQRLEGLDTERLERPLEDGNSAATSAISKEPRASGL